MRSIIILLLSFLIGCKQSHQPAQIINSAKYTRLLKKFKEISIDTLEVFSLADGIQIENYRYKGVLLDSLDAVLFPKNISQAHFADPPGLFACYRFKIDSLRQGLIARTPSEYYPSSIKLFIYTSGKDTLIETAELAQYIGDAGSLMDINSWLLKGPNKSIDAFVWSHESFDNSVEDEKDTTLSEWHHFSLYNLSKNTYDTLDNRIERLPAHFLDLVKKKLNSKHISRR